MKVKRFTLGVAGTNCYVFECNKKVFCIDPGQEPALVIKYIVEKWNRLDYILITHCHFDHIAGIDNVKKVFSNAKIYAPLKELDWFKNTNLNLSNMCDLNIIVDSKPEPLENANLDIKILSTPGHSHDSKSFYIEDEGIVFSGDALFKGTIGRCDLPNSSENILLESIKNNLLTLPKNTIVYPGHGFSTTIKEELENNPYFSQGE